MIVHFIWVGENKIPQPFLSNLEDFKKLNPSEEILEWNDTQLIPLIRSYGREDLYFSSSIFHKLQIARYTVLDYYGGLYTDYDIQWKKPIIEGLGKRIESDLTLIKRKSVYFYKTPQCQQGQKVVKTTLLDDYVIFAKSGITNNFLEYCLERSQDKSRIKDSETEPFSVYALTEWVLSNEMKVEYFSADEIYNDDVCTLAYHDNKKTWEIKD